MSLLLYRGNNLVVEGSLGAEYFCKESSEQKDKRRHLYLRFFVQINGQMRVFDQMFTLTGDIENSPTVFQSQWCLEDWSVWYTLKSILGGLGYQLSEEKIHEYGGDHHIITDWLITLFNDELNSK